MLFGGELTSTVWTEARSSFINGNYIATVMLCQSLAEHLLAAYLSAALNGDELPNRTAFKETLKRCLAKGVLGREDATQLQRLMELRNPISHYRIEAPTMSIT
jgi:HEPN domain-containing protein